MNPGDLPSAGGDAEVWDIALCFPISKDLNVGLQHADPKHRRLRSIEEFCAIFAGLYEVTDDKDGGDAKRKVLVNKNRVIYRSDQCFKVTDKFDT